MLDPVVVSIPLALAFIAALAVGAVAVDRYLRTDIWNPWDGQSWAEDPTRVPLPIPLPPTPPGARHRLGTIDAPYRPHWATPADLAPKPLRLPPYLTADDDTLQLAAVR